MLFLMDPAHVRIGPAAWFFVVVVCLVLPVAALRQHRLLAGHPLGITRTQLYASGLATHAMLLVLVWFVLRRQEMSFLGPFSPGWSDIGIGIGALALGVAPFLRRARTASSERTRFIAPRSGREFGLFYLLSISAGFTEQLAYRGVLFTLLAAIAGSWWLAAAGAALAFGLGHLFQGWRAAGLASLIGLRDHLVVGLTGTLWVAIVVHMLHDAIAGTAIGWLARRDEREEAALAVP